MLESASPSPHLVLLRRCAWVTSCRVDGQVVVNPCDTWSDLALSCGVRVRDEGLDRAGHLLGEYSSIQSGIGVAEESSRNAYAQPVRAVTDEATSLINRVLTAMDEAGLRRLRLES